MKLDVKDWRKVLKLWASLFEVARYILFMHHVFWMVGVILLFNPVGETFWPSAAQEKHGQPTPRPSGKAQIRAVARRARAKSKPWPASEGPAERLARLRQDKEAVDQKIGHLTNKQ